MRVVSCRPGPASCSGRPLLSSTAATAEAATCGRWLTRATAASCCSAVSTTGSAPHRSATSRTAARAPADVSGLGHSTHGRPTNRPPAAAAGPDSSLPAIGWLPQTSASGTPAAARSACTVRCTDATWL
jgi:hypothetical protein